MKAGDRFGRLTAVRPWAITKRRLWTWKFACDCGKKCIKVASSVRLGATRSCGCLHHEMLLRRNFKHGGSPRSGREPLYEVWKRMKQRCENKTCYHWQRWGGRGIRVLWTDYATFRSDMLSSYRPGLQIERVDNNGHYCKENCKWATPKEQANNTRRNVFIEFQGQRLSVAEWSRRLGIKRQTLLWRLHAGWSGQRALTSPVGRYKAVT